MRKYDLKLFDEVAGGNSALLRNKIGNYARFAGGDWMFMGTGITQLDESPGAQTDSEVYINDVTASADITKYETTFPYTHRLIPNQKVLYKLWKMGRDHATGDAATLEVASVELFNPIGEPTAEKAEFTARLFTVINAVSSTSGNGGEKIQVSGELRAKGDPIQGKFDTVAMEFTEGDFKGALDIDAAG